MLFDTQGYFADIPAPKISQFGKEFGTIFSTPPSPSQPTFPKKVTTINQPITKKEAVASKLTTNTSSLQNKEEKIVISKTFINAGFDIYTFRVYAHVAEAQQANGYGLLETTSSIAKKTKISEVKVRECLALLEVCKIISLEQRRDPTTLFGTVSIIILNPEEKWFLLHEFRDANEYFLAQKYKFRKTKVS